MADFNEETIRELNDSIRELTSVMGSAMGITGSSVNTQKTFNKAMADTAGTSAILNSKNKEVAQSATSVSAANKVAAAAAYKVGESFGTLYEATKQGKDALLTFGKTMLDTREGLSKYGAALNQASSALSTGLSAFGPIGRGLGALLKPLTMLAEGVLGFQDNLFEAKDELAKFGAVGRFTTDDVLELGKASGYTSGEIVKYAKMATTAGVGLVNLGGTVNQGVVEFSKLTNITREERNRLRTLGVSMDDFVQNTADFVKLQTMSGRIITQEMRTSGALQRAAKDYTDNLLVLAALSGEDVSTQKQKQMQLSMEREAQIADLATTKKIAELRKGNEADNREADRLERKMKLEVAARDLTQATLGMDAAKALQHFLKTGVVTPETLKIMRNSEMSLEEFREAIASGKDVSAKFVTGLAKADLQLVESQQLALQLNKEYADGMGINQERLTKLAALQGRNVEDVMATIRKDADATKLKDDQAEKDRNARNEAEIKLRENIDILAKQLAGPVSTGLTEMTKFMAKMSGELANVDFKKLWNDIKTFFEDVKKGLQDFTDYLKIAGLGLLALGGSSLMGKGSTLGGFLGGAMKWTGGLTAAGVGGFAAGEIFNKFFESSKGTSFGSWLYDKMNPNEGKEFGKVESQSGQVDLDSLFNFGQNSGSKQNFFNLNENLRNALIAAASEYTQQTGKKITINSAFRSEADQKRLWDESVEAGRPGIGRTGMKIAKPGNSLHERGLAVDIQEYSDATLDGILKKHGLDNTVRGDPVHYTLQGMPGARLGGSFSGPNSGYPVMLHGNETVVPTPNPNTTLLKVEGDSAAEKITSALSGMNSDALRSVMEQMYQMMDERLSEMVDKLSTSNDLQDKLLKVQM